MGLWAVQSNFINNKNVVEITDALKKHDIPFVTLGIMPFSRELKLDHDNDVDVADLGLDILPYGSTTLLKVAMERGWRRLSFNGNFDARVWNEHRSDMLNRDAVVSTVSEAGERAARLDPDEPLFIRPVGDLKLFAGTVAPAAEVAQWMTSAESGNFSFSADDLVSVAAPKNIQAEWRHFICGGEIVSSSMYRAHGRMHARRETDAAVLKEAQALANIWLPHDNCVMDLALADDVLQPVEFNCINGSGFYDHDIEQIVVMMNIYS